MIDPLASEKRLADAAHEAWSMLGTALTTKEPPTKTDMERVYSELAAALSDATGDDTYEG